MRKVFIIGTIHGKYTPCDELLPELEKINPDQVLVELPNLPEAELKKRRIYAEEMICAYDWAESKKLAVGKFDVDDTHSYFKQGKGPDDSEYKDLFKRQQKIVEKYSWKKFNNPSYNNLLNDPLLDTLFDSTQEEKRESQMLHNINQLMLQEGNITIITGTGHIDFFGQNLGNAVIPLRSEKRKRHRM